MNLWYCTIKNNMSKNNSTSDKNSLMLSYFTNIFGFSLFVPLYAAFIVNLGQSPEKASFLWAVYTLIFGCTVILIGKIQDTMKMKSFKNSLVFGYFLRLAATIVFLVGLESYVLFSVGLIVYGLGSAFLTPSWFSIFAKQTKNHPASNWSLSEGGGALFSAAGAALGGFLFAFGGYQTIFYCMIAMHIIGLITASSVKNN